MHRFKIDENLPIEVAESLRNAGHDAVTVLDQNLGGRPDAAIAAVCRDEEPAVVTFDRGFGDMRAYAPKEHVGVVLLRLRKQEKPHVLQVIERLLPTLREEPLAGTLWVVDETAVRIHRGDR